jgi:hypothetical protein
MVDGASLRRAVPHLLAIERMQVPGAALAEFGRTISEVGGIPEAEEQFIAEERGIARRQIAWDDPRKHPETKQEPACSFADWLVSPEGQAAIGRFKIAGEQLFHPSADTPK